MRGEKGGGAVQIQNIDVLNIHIMYAPNDTVCENIQRGNREYRVCEREISPKRGKGQTEDVSAGEYMEV